MKCCPECIGDTGFKNNISPMLSSELGRCDYCNSNDVLLLEPPKLRQYFDPLLAIYSPSEEGDLLVDCLRQDWGIFGRDKIDKPNASYLLGEILDDGEVGRKFFKPMERYQTNRVEAWHELRDELKHGNRFFPYARIENDRIEELLSYLIVYSGDLGSTWFRARILDREDPFCIEEMSAPPRHLATPGRANPAGIPYLYLSSCPDTAISEIRPGVGETSCVGVFRTPSDLTLVDLRNPKESVSPFLLGEEDLIGNMRGDVNFLVSLGEELTRPVLPRSASIDYVPSQYLCEFIKKCGYNGVAYRSSISQGMNIALFDAGDACGDRVCQYIVSEVNLRTRAA